MIPLENITVRNITVKNKTLKPSICITDRELSKRSLFFFLKDLFMGLRI